MTKYILRKCPKCRDRIWFDVNQMRRSNGERAINAYCALCGYSADGWRLILGGKGSPKTPADKMRKVFT